MYPVYEKYAKTLQQILTKAATRLAPLSIVQARPKSLSSFGEKIYRRKNMYDDPVNQFTDLCGGRVITHTQDEVTAVCEFIKNNFQVDWNNSADTCERLSPSEFGYRSIHYIVKFKPNHFPTKDVDINVPSEVFGLKSEIQVRTLLEHAWADFSHDRTYKSSFQIPQKWQRELAAVAASLEEADKAFSRIHKGLQDYVSSYQKCMNENEIHEEIKKLELISEYDPDNLEIANSIGKLAIILEEWKKASHTLSKYANSGYEPILRDLGVALYKGSKPQSEKYKQGQEYLRIASEMKDDADALCSLAGSWKGIDDEKAKGLYYRAYEVDPSNSYALGNCLNYEIARTHDLSALRLARPAMFAAMKKIHDQIEVKVNLPWAYFDLGKFRLLLEDPYESIYAYSKSIQLSPTAWMITTSLNGLQRTIGSVVEKPVGYDWVIKLLQLGQLTRALSDEEKKKCMVPILAATTKNRGCLSGPVLIVAGGCGEEFESQIQIYHQTIIDAFQGFKGTIISGGTTSGFSGLIGEVAQKYPKEIRAVGYVPRKLPVGISVDKRYTEIRRTNGCAFSPLEPLQYWIDIVASGIHPSKVRLLGINGGKIAAAEYRIALALGAKVAMLEGTGREAQRLLSDPEWADPEMGLLSLPANKDAIRSFLNSKRPERSKENSSEL
jgi:ppGpp synthetase/RelA/SpoT-type nucleotidyltranferase